MGSKHELRQLKISMYLLSNYSLSVQYMSSKHDSLYVMKYVYRGPIFSSLISNKAYRLVRKVPKPSQATVIALARCTQFNVFIVSTFETSCHHVQQEDIDPSGKRWNCDRELYPGFLQK